MNGNATWKITENIRDEFSCIRRDVQRHLGPDVTVDHARTLLAQHVPALVVGRSQILLDSLLNYLMEDAISSLTDAPTEVKNDFYDQDLRAQIRGSFSLDAQTLTLSFDRRLIYGGVAAGSVLVAGGAAVLLLPIVFSPLLIGLGSIVASAIAFRVAYSAATEPARGALKSDVAAYLAESEAQVKEWLGRVENAFDESFAQYATRYGIRRGDAA